MSKTDSKDGLGMGVSQEETQALDGGGTELRVTRAVTQEQPVIIWRI